MATIQASLVTAEEFLQITADHDGLLELVRGEVREMNRPGSIHGFVCMNVGGELRTWAKGGRHGRVVCNDAGVVIQRDPDTVRGPDVYFIREDRLPNGELPAGWLEVAPDLCAEVLSPTDRWPDVLEKINEYFRMGVPEVWVLDPAKRQVHLHRADTPAPSILDVDQTLTSPHLPGFVCPISELFAGC